MLANRIAGNIQRLREARGWSRPELGRRCRPMTSGQQIERLEKGQRGLTVEWIERLAGALNVAPGELIVCDQAQFELTSQVADEVARHMARVALRGAEPDQAIVDVLGLILSETLGMFVRHPAMRSDPEAVAPVLELLSRGRGVQ